MKNDEDCRCEMCWRKADGEDGMCTVCRGPSNEFGICDDAGFDLVSIQARVGKVSNETIR